MTRHIAPAAAMFKGASGNTLVADVYGEDGPPVLLLHGGGQTRHAWKRTGELIVALGRVAYAVDQRGHGDSEWVEDGAYEYTDFAADARVLADTLAERSGVRPAVVGASLGGMAALLANSQPGKPQHFSALVLVDITPRVDIEGVGKIQSFMRAHLRKASAPSPRPPMRSRPICRTGRGHARTRD
jgi:pimeloyl-ACP methyl ester carboxylesterase